MKLPTTRTAGIFTAEPGEERAPGENPFGYYRLEEDLDFSGIQPSEGSYIPGRFTGILEGNGRSLMGMKAPLFGDLQHAQVRDLTILNPSYQEGAEALFAVKTRKVILGNIRPAGADPSLPLVRTSTEGYYVYQDSDPAAEENIPAPEELVEQEAPSGPPVFSVDNLTTVRYTVSNSC